MTTDAEREGPFVRLEREGGVRHVVLDRPERRNAVSDELYADLERVLQEVAADPGTRSVLLSGQGRSFCAGADLKAHATRERTLPERRAYVWAGQRTTRLLQTLPVPVVAAVQGFCLGGGIGLVGNADVIVASDDATFGLPEVDRGALGAATHLSRLVPQHLARAMLYTSRTVTAQRLYELGSVLEVVEPDALRDTALEVAREIASKDATVMRAAKESLNGIDLWDVKRSYRYEQGFTFELNLLGVADEVRADFGR